MISTVIAMVLATQATDTTRAARESFTACLRTYVNQSIAAGTSMADFRTAYPQQCTAQQSAFREAVLRRETALRATRANAEQQASMEIDDARTNFGERFEMSMTPEPGAQQQAAAQPAAAQPAVQTTAQPAVQPAAQTTAPQ